MGPQELLSKYIWSIYWILNISGHRQYLQTTHTLHFWLASKDWHVCYIELRDTDTYDKIVKTGMCVTVNYVLVLTDTLRFIHSMKKQTVLYFTFLEVPKNIALILF